MIEPRPKNWVEALVRAAAEALQGLVRAIPEDVRRVLADPALREEVAAVFRDIAEDLQAELTAYEADPYAFFFDEMVWGTGESLRHLITREGDRLLVDVLEEVLDEDLSEQATTAIGSAPYLSSAQRERLVAGLHALHAPTEHWTEPCDRLLVGLDGALWAVAEATGVANEQGHLLHHPRQRKATGPNGLLDPKHGLVLDPSFRRFLDHRVFDGRGHALRHGRGDHGHRTYALLAASAVLGWLDHHADTELMLTLAKRLDTWTEQYVEALPEPIEG